MKRHRSRKRLAHRLKVIVLTATVLIIPSAVYAASVDMGPDVAYTEGRTPVQALPGFDLAGSTQSYLGQSVTFSLEGEYTSQEELGFQQSAPSTVLGAISVQGTTVFKGDGTSATAIGSIDPTLNGEAKDLKVSFTNAFTNGDFSNGSTGWTVANERTNLGYARADGTIVTTGASVIGGWPVPVDYLWGPGNTPTSSNAIVNRDRAISANLFSTTSNNELTMTVGDANCATGFCVIRGPSVVSNSAVYLAIGDTVSFTWIARAGTDAFDVYGYLLNTENGKAIRLIDETGRVGANANGSVSVTLGSERNMTGYYSGAVRRADLVNYATSGGVIGASVYDDTKFTDGSSVTAGSYKFVFVAGAYDDSGFRGLGANFTIDNVAVSPAVPNTVTASDVQALARLLVYANTDATSGNRSLSFSSSISEDRGTSTILVTAVNDSPVLAPVSPITFTDTPADDTFAVQSGTLSSTDEEGNAVTYGLTGAKVVGTKATLARALGTMELNTVTGAYTFTPNAGAINALDANSSISFVFTASDGQDTGSGTLIINFTATLDAKPGPPVIDSIVAGDRELTLFFTAPISSGTSAITNYRYSTDGGSTFLAFSPAATEGPLRITSLSDITGGVSVLENGAPYNIVLRAVNMTGESVDSNSVSATPKQTIVRSPGGSGGGSSPVPSASPRPSPSSTPKASQSPTPRPSISERPTPGATPSASAPPTQNAQANIERAELSLVEPARPTQKWIEHLNQNPDLGSVSDFGFVAVNPSQSLVITGGEPDEVRIYTKDDLTGYVVEGNGFSIAFGSTSDDGSAAELDGDGNLVLTAGQTLKLEGSGFSPGTQVALWLFSEPQKLGEVTADAMGNFGGALSLPADLEFGNHTIQINGVTPTGDVRSVHLGVVANDYPPPVPFDPLSTPEGVEALTDSLGNAAAVVGAIAAAAAAAGGGSGGSGSSGSGGQGNQGGSIATIDAAHERFTNRRRGQGDKWKIWKKHWVRFSDKFSIATVISSARFSPLFSKIAVDGAYLRAAFGSLGLLPAVAAVLISVMTVAMNEGEVLTPQWQWFIALAVIGIFDAFAGLVGTLIFVAGTVVMHGAALSMDDVRLLLGVIIVGYGPALLANAFRVFRKEPQEGEEYWWERLVDLVVLPFIGGWVTATMISMLPALAGTTMAVANHANEFAIAIAIAITLRVVFEESVGRWFPARLNTLHPTDVDDADPAQKWISVGFRLAIFIFVTAALMGNVWQVWVGSALFILPTIIGFYSHKFKNFPWIWRILPTGIPGLAFTLVVASVTTSVVGSWFGSSPDLALWSFALLPVPMLALAILGMIGREGNEGEIRWIRRPGFKWVYRIGGVFMLLATMDLAGVLDIFPF